MVAIRHRSETFDCIYTDENLAFRPLLKHLLEHHGLKKIRFLAGYKGHPDSEMRLQVYREEMTAHGLTVDETVMDEYQKMYMDNTEKIVLLVLD